MANGALEDGVPTRRVSRPHIKNAILADLPWSDLRALSEYLEPIALRERAILHESRRRVDYIYFLESGVVSLRIVAGDSVLETAIEGYRGAVGASYLLGCVPTHISVVMCPGKALRVRAEDLRRLMNERPQLRKRIMQYVQALAFHSSQIALCGVRHDVAKRLACWLCLTCDALDGRVLPVTHEYLSMVLGLRRAGITETLNSFESDGLIKKMRGVLQVDDRRRLEARACSCYNHIASEYTSIECRAYPEQGIL
jgi:CRP-like cAMP-binding protein